MKLVYLSPHFPPNFQNFVRQLHALGAVVLGVADVPFEALDSSLQQSLTEYIQVGDMHDYDALVRALGILTYRHGHLDRVESHNEYWLETEAALRTDFNLVGVRSDAVGRVKRKSMMKDVFRQAGMEVPPGTVVETLAQARRFAADVGYPLVAKPDIGVGAEGAMKIDDDDALQRFIAHRPPKDYLLEKFVDGELCSFDGLTDGNGQIVFCTSHVFSRGIMEILSNDENLYYYSVRHLSPDLERAGRAVVEAFAIRDRFFHIEFFRRHSDQQLVALEMNMRPPGGWTTDMFNFANDIDIYRAWAEVVMNGRSAAPASRPYHCMYVGRKANRKYRFSHDDLLRTATDRLAHHAPVQSVFAPVLGDHGYLVRDPELEPLLAFAHAAMDRASTGATLQVPGGHHEPMS